MLLSWSTHRRLTWWACRPRTLPACPSPRRLPSPSIRRRRPHRHHPAAATVVLGQPTGATIGTFVTTDPTSVRRGTDAHCPRPRRQPARRSPATPCNEHGVLSPHADDLQRAGADDRHARPDLRQDIYHHGQSSGPTDIGLSDTTVTAYQPVATTVGTLSTTDTNTGQSWTYTLLGSNSTLFAIQGNILVTNTIFQVNMPTTYTIDVQTTDTLGLSYTKQFTITVNPTTANPTDIALFQRDRDHLPGHRHRRPGHAEHHRPERRTVASLHHCPRPRRQPVHDQRQHPDNEHGLHHPATDSVQMQTTDTAAVDLHQDAYHHGESDHDGTHDLHRPCPAPTHDRLPERQRHHRHPYHHRPERHQAFTYSVVAGPTATCSRSAEPTGDQRHHPRHHADHLRRGRADDRHCGPVLHQAVHHHRQPDHDSPHRHHPGSATATTYQASGATIGTFTTTDPNAGQSYYTIVPGLDGNVFAIAGDTLETAAVFTTATTYSVQVQTTDTAGLSFTKTLIISFNPTTGTHLHRPGQCNGGHLPGGRHDHWHLHDHRPQRQPVVYLRHCCRPQQ